MNRLFYISPFKLLQFFFKVAEVFELTVHRGKAHVGNIVEAFEFCHDKFTNVLFGFYFSFASAYELIFDSVGDFLDLSCRDWAFGAGEPDFVYEFVFVKDFAPSIGFYDGEGGVFDVFVGRKSTFASEAFSAAADSGAFFARSGIYYFIFDHATIRTFHEIGFLS